MSLAPLQSANPLMFLWFGRSTDVALPPRHFDGITGPTRGARRRHLSPQGVKPFFRRATHGPIVRGRWRVSIEKPDCRAHLHNDDVIALYRLLAFGLQTLRI
jgi:hypothetical protein